MLVKRRGVEKWFFLPTAIALALAGVLSMQRIAALREATTAISQSKDVQLSLETTLSTLKDAETGQRGYLLTHRPEYLQSYANASQSISATLDQATKLIEDDEAQRIAMVHFTQLAQAKLDELRQTIELNDSTSTTAALSKIASGEGRRLMEDIRQLVMQMQSREKARLEAANTQAEKERTLVSAAIGGMTALGIILLMLLTYFTRRDSLRLHKSKEELSIILRGIGDGVIVTNDVGHVTFINRVACELTGWSEPEVPNLPLTEILPLVDETTRLPIEDLITRALRETVIVDDSNRALLIRRDGSLVPIENNTATLHDPDGKILGMVLVFKDASERRHTEDTLRKADRHKDEFLATLAHELRNPLNPIKNAIRILESPQANEKQRRWGLEVINRQIGNMSLLLEDLLNVARITRGHVELRKADIQLEQLVDLAVEIAQPLIDKKQQSLQIRLPKDAIALHVDPLRMSQVLSNLLTNAAKYTDAGGAILLTAGIVENELLISVKDTGIGISAESIPKLFGIFSQLHTTIDRSEGGLGIGLALVKGLVELHGGKIEARSEGLGHGSEFIVRLSRSDIAPKQSASDPRDKQTLNDQTDAAKEILIADDNRDTAESLALVLRLAGYRVHTAFSGAEAIALGVKFRPHAMIVDIGMPGVNGYEVARYFRREDWSNRALLISMTGWSQESTQLAAKNAGFDHHLVKPIDTEDLLKLLSAININDKLLPLSPQSETMGAPEVAES